MQYRALMGLFHDPVAEAKLAIEDSEKIISGFTGKIAKLGTQIKVQSIAYNAAVAESRKYLKFAKKALEAGNNEDVAEATKIAGVATKRMDELFNHMERNKAVMNTLQHQLRLSRTRVSQARMDIASLEARYDGAMIRKEMAKAATNFNTNDSPLAVLNNLEKLVSIQEAEADAWEDLAPGLPESTLEAKYGSD